MRTLRKRGVTPLIQHLYAFEKSLRRLAPKAAKVSRNRIDEPMRKADDDVCWRYKEEVLWPRQVLHSHKEIEVHASADPLDANPPHSADLAARWPQKPKPDPQFLEVQNIQPPIKCHQVTDFPELRRERDPNSRPFALRSFIRSKTALRSAVESRPACSRDSVQGPRRRRSVCRLGRALGAQITSGEQWASLERLAQVRHDLFVGLPFADLERGPTLYLSPCVVVDQARDAAVSARRAASDEVVGMLAASPHEVANQSFISDQRCKAAARHAPPLMITPPLRRSNSGDVVEAQALVG